MVTYIKDEQVFTLVIGFTLWCVQMEMKMLRGNYLKDILSINI